MPGPSPKAFPNLWRGSPLPPPVWADDLIDDPHDIVDTIRRTGRYDGNATSSYKSAYTPEDNPAPGTYGRLLPHDAERLAELRRKFKAADAKRNGQRRAYRKAEDRYRQRQLELHRQQQLAQQKINQRYAELEQAQLRAAQAAWASRLPPSTFNTPDPICALCSHSHKPNQDPHTWSCNVLGDLCANIRAHAIYRTCYAFTAAPDAEEVP